MAEDHNYRYAAMYEFLNELFPTNTIADFHPSVSSADVHSNSATTNIYLYATTAFYSYTLTDVHSHTSITNKAHNDPGRQG